MTVTELPMFTCEIGDRDAETMMLSISSVDAAFV
jgi:hypothetical protein